MKTGLEKPWLLPGIDSYLFSRVVNFPNLKLYTNLNILNRPSKINLQLLFLDASPGKLERCLVILSRGALIFKEHGVLLSIAPCSIRWPQVFVLLVTERYDPTVLPETVRFRLSIADPFQRSNFLLRQPSQP